MNEAKRMSSVRQMVNNLTKKFEGTGSDAPHVCARALVSHVLGADSLFLATHPNFILSQALCEQLESLAHRHMKGEPLAYLVGEKEFYGRPFYVNAHTLIPRPESEDVLDALLTKITKDDAIFLDIGTGSGCLAVTLAAEREGFCGIMLDKCAGALAVAQENAKRLGVAQRLLALCGNLYALPITEGSLDIIISNPPYVSSTEYEGLDVSVKAYEPLTALVPSDNAEDVLRDGLEHFRELAQGAHSLLRRGGVCIVEHGSRQGHAVAEIFSRHAQWASVKIGYDMSGLERFCLCEKY